MASLNKNVWVLTVSQALMMSAASMVVFIGGLIGSELAPSESLATLPVTSIIIGSALSTIPVALSMKKFGRKKAFIAFSIFAIIVSLVSAYAIQISSFYLICISFAFLGVAISNVNQFRFAAMESVAPELMPKAASTVLLGGIAAAFIGPEVAVLGKNLFTQHFTGSFVLLSGLYVLGAIGLLFYKNIKHVEHEATTKGRTIFQIASQPIFWVAVLSAMIGYVVMSFIMTATPVSMHVMDGHSLQHTKWVIQSHIVAMFLPSLITPYIIHRIGTFKVIISGLVIFALCIAIALLGKDLFNYWVSLVLLGIGWNFLFLGGTTLLPLSYKDNEKYKVQALNEFMVFGTQSIASLSAGIVVFSFGWEVIQLSMIPALFIPLIAIIYLKAKKQKQ